MSDKMRRPTLLMTRPRASSETFVARLMALGAELGTVVISPAIAIETRVTKIDPRPFEAVILTSRHGAAALRPSPDFQAWCVGDATAKAAALLGYDAVSAGGSVDDLARLIVAERPKGRLLYLRGQIVSADLVTRLGRHGIDVEERIVYDQPERPATPEALALFQTRGPVVAPLFSERSAHILATWAEGAKAAIEAVAIGDAVALAWGGPGRVALRPSVDAMADAVATALAEGANG